MLSARRARKPSDEEALLCASWAAFSDELPTSQACVASLQEMAELDGKLRSPCCFELQPEGTYGERNYKCPKCRQLVWVTAGTFFDGIRDPITWRGAIWLYEEGLTPNATDLERLSGASYSSCWEICRKLNMVILEQILDGLTPVESAFFQEIVFRRTRVTPAGKHPRAEQAEIEKDCLDAVDKESLDDFTEEQISILEVLSAKAKPVHFDILCAKTNMPSKDMSAFLMLLELSGAVQRLVGDRYVRITKSKKVNDVDDLPPELQLMISAFKNFVKAKFQGISRKYLQLYLAAFVCFLNRGKWERGRILNACWQRRKIRRKDLLDYVTPEHVFMSAA